MAITRLLNISNQHDTSVIQNNNQEKNDQVVKWIDQNSNFEKIKNIEKNNFLKIMQNLRLKLPNYKRVRVIYMSHTFLRIPCLYFSSKKHFSLVDLEFQLRHVLYDSK